MSDSNSQVPATKAGAIPGLPDDWDQKATVKLLDTVDLVRQKTAGPAIGVARAVVYGLVAVVLGIIAAILLIIGLVRLIDSYLPATVWATYLILGSIFLLVGLFLWSKRPKRAVQ